MGVVVLHELTGREAGLLYLLFPLLSVTTMSVGTSPDVSAGLGDGLPVASGPGPNSGAGQTMRAARPVRRKDEPSGTRALLLPGGPKSPRTRS